MAYEHKILSASLTMNASSTAKQYYIVKATTAANTVDFTATAGERALGVVQEKSSSGDVAEILVYGITKVAHDGTLTPGARFMASTAGLAIAVSTAAGVYELGTVLEAGSTVSGTIVTALWEPYRTTN